MTVTPLPHWRTIPETAKAVGVSEWLLRQEIKSGRLRARRIGRVVRLLDEDVSTWMRGEEAS